MAGRTPGASRLPAEQAGRRVGADTRVNCTVCRRPRRDRPATARSPGRSGASSCPVARELPLGRKLCARRFSRPSRAARRGGVPRNRTTEAGRPRRSRWHALRRRRGRNRDVAARVAQDPFEQRLRPRASRRTARAARARTRARTRCVSAPSANGRITTTPRPQIGGGGEDLALDVAFDRVVGHLDGGDAARSP